MEKCEICGKEECVIVETKKDGSESRICIECGYNTMSSYKLDDDAHRKGAPLLVLEMAKEDKRRNQYWYPATLDLPRIGIVFPDRLEGEIDVKWGVLKYDVIPMHERKNYILQPGTNFCMDYRVDIKEARHFDFSEFKSALLSLRAIPLTN